MSNQQGTTDPTYLSSHHIRLLKGMLDKFDISSFSSYLEKEDQSNNILNLLLIYALQLIHHNQILTYEIIDLLLSKGASPDILIQFSFNQYVIDEKDKVTLLMFSLLTKDIELFTIVIKYAPNIKLRDAKNLNAILYYVLYNRDEDVKVLQDLIGLNADVNSNAEVEISPGLYEWHSVFTIACKNNMKRAVKVLIENSVDVNYITNVSRNTGIHLALIEGHIELVTMLIQISGIRLDIANKNGHKAIDIAKIKGKEVFGLFTHQSYRDGEALSSKTGAQTLNALNKSIDAGNMSINESEDNKEDSNTSTVINAPLKKKGSVQFSDDTANYQNSPSQMVTTHNNSAKEGKIFVNLNKRRNQLTSYKIPLEFKGNVYKQSPYLRIENTPLLCLDLPDMTIDLDAKIKEMQFQLNEEARLLKKLEDTLQQSNMKYSEFSKILEAKEAEIRSMTRLEEENQKEKEELKKQNEEMQKKLNLMPTPIHREITKKEYIDLKFNQVKYDEVYLIKSLQRDLIDYRNLIKDEISRKRMVVDQLIANLQLVVNTVTPDYTVVLFGSYATGLCLPWSDIDVVLVNKSGKVPIDNFLLRKIYNVLLTKKGWIYETKIIETAFIPIIKLVSTDQYLSFKIDISIEDDKHYGLKCVDLIKSYLKEYDILEPLIIALKTILQNANLNDPYVGGMSSYGIILMVVSFIQNQSNTENELTGECKLGKAFVRFLEHFGLCFDFSKYVILIYPINDTNNTNSTYEQDINFGNSHDLIIVDPLNKQNNVAKTSYQFNNIKMAFMIAFMVTKEDCECGCHYGGALYDNEYFATEHCILKRMFNSVKRYSESNSK